MDQYVEHTGVDLSKNWWRNPKFESQYLTFYNYFLFLTLLIVMRKSQLRLCQCWRLRFSIKRIFYDKCMGVCRFFWRGLSPWLPPPQAYAYGRASSSGAKFTWLMVGQDF